MRRLPYLYNHPEKSNVVIVKGTEPLETTKRALNMIPDDISFESGERVLIKPNCVRPVAPVKGVTTDAGVVEAIIEFLKKKGVSNIVIAEGGNPGINKAFKVTGLKDLEKKHGVELVNINDDKWEEIPIPGALALGKARVSKTVLDCDRIVNVPKLKIHHMAQVTLNLKNFMGVIVGNRGLVMHDRLDYKIVDLASLFKPVLNVVDGIVGAEMDEVVGKPVNSNVIIAGVDMVSVDAVGSAVMGLNPIDVRHIQLAADRGLGVASMDRIKIIGETIDEVRIMFSTDFSDEKLRTYGLSKPLSEEDLILMMNSFTHRDPQKEDPYQLSRE